jgi:hypothetical protein
MNHEFLWALLSPSPLIPSYRYGDLRYTRSHWMGVSFAIDMSTGSSRWTIARWSNWGPRSIPPHDTKLFSLSRSIRLCYLEVSVEEGKLAKGWCVTV